MCRRKPPLICVRIWFGYPHVVNKAEPFFMLVHPHVRPVIVPAFAAFAELVTPYCSTNWVRISIRFLRMQVT